MYPYQIGVLFYGFDNRDSTESAYCDHFHLYSFYYNTITLIGEDDYLTDLVVYGHGMTGFPDACGYSSAI